jgi:hypothetical protein
VVAPVMPAVSQLHHLQEEEGGEVQEVWVQQVPGSDSAHLFCTAIHAQQHVLQVAQLAAKIMTSCYYGVGRSTAEHRRQGPQQYLLGHQMI